MKGIYGGRIVESVEEYISSVKKNTDKLMKQLDEIGDSSVPPYKWHKTPQSVGSMEWFAFDADGMEYKVLIHTKSDEIGIDYFADDDTEVVTNQGNQYKIMSTVMDIVRDKLDRDPNIKVISFVPSQNFDNDKRREKFYTAYIKKEFGGSDITSGSNGSIKAKIK